MHLDIHEMTERTTSRGLDVRHDRISETVFRDTRPVLYGLHAAVLATHCIVEVSELTDHAIRILGIRL